jgi:hypothetical protein
MAGPKGKQVGTGVRHHGSNGGPRCGSGNGAMRARRKST